MADYFQKFLGGTKATVSSVASTVEDGTVPNGIQKRRWLQCADKTFPTDFADFATAASPVAPSHAASSAASATAAASVFGGFNTAQLGAEGRPFTKWVRI